MRIINKINNIILSNKIQIENFSYLTLLQFFNLLIPLITYPYLIKTLGKDLYGKVIFAQVISTYFGIVIDFGYRIYGTKEISIHRHNKNKLSEIISSILIIKTILWFLSLIFLIILILCIPYLYNNIWLYLFSYLICFNEFLFPQWYFQGIERMKYITLINLFTRTLFLIAIFFIVKDKMDYLYVPLLNGIGSLLGGVIGLYIIFIKDKIHFSFYNIYILFFYMKESFFLFSSNVIISIKDRLGLILIGSKLQMGDVAIYDLSLKIMSLFMIPVEITNSTIYPKISREKNMKFMIKISTILFFLMLFLIITIQPLLKIIISFLGNSISDAIIPTRILLIAPLIMVWSLALARNCLIVFNKTRIFTIGMILTTIFYLALIGIVYLIGININVITFVIITVLTYLFELIFRIYAVKKYNLIK